MNVLRNIDSTLRGPFTLKKVGLVLLIVVVMQVAAAAVAVMVRG